MSTLFFVIWELPQNLAGLILWLVTRPKQESVVRSGNRLLIKVTGFSVSLGSFIFWQDDRYMGIPNRVTNRQHEWGHSVQSRWLGPFYLLIIGIPSSLRNLYGRWVYNRTGQYWTGYYDGFPERQANELGNRFTG